MPDLNSRAEQLLNSRVGCAFLVMLDEGSITLDCVEDPVVAFQVTASGATKFQERQVFAKPWSDTPWAPVGEVKVDAHVVGSARAGRKATARVLGGMGSFAPYGPGSTRAGYADAAIVLQC